MSTFETSRKYNNNTTTSIITIFQFPYGDRYMITHENDINGGIFISV